jgi:hypothetical protein
MTKLGNEIKQIVAIDSESFSVQVEFYDGAVVAIPLGHIFENPKGLAAEVLRGGMFHKCFLESGSLAWPNGLELCPDAMRMWAEEKEANRLGQRRKRA